MRNPISLTIILLILWIAASSFIYVCVIRDHCGQAPETEETTQQVNEPEQAEIIPEPYIDSSAASEPEPVPDPVGDAAKYLEEKGTQFIYFEFAKSQASIPEEFSSYAGRLSTYLEGTTGSKVYVTGHADAIGTVEAKDRISFQRARFVSDYLVQQGIPLSAIVVEGKGDREPVAANDTEEGRSQNRRVEIKIKK